MKGERNFLVFLLFATVVVLSQFISPIYAFAVIPALVLMAILIGSPRAVFLGYMGLMLTYTLIYENIPHAFIKHSNKVFGAALFAILLGQLAFRRMSLKGVRAFKHLSLAMFAYIVFVWLLNRSGIRPLAQSVLIYFSFIPLFVIGRAVVRKSDFMLFLKAGLSILWVSFVLNMGWRLGINPLFNFHLSMGNFTDAFKGIFPHCNSYAYYCCLLVIFLTSVLTCPQLGLSRRWRSIIYISLPVLLFELYFTKTNHSYAILMASLGPFIFLSGLWKKWQSLFLAALLAVAIVTGYTVSDDLQAQFSKENLTYRVDRLVYGAKYQLYEKVFKDNLQDNPVEWVFGVGPGNGVGSVGKDNLTDYALRMLLEFYQRGEEVQRVEGQMNSISGLTDAGYITLWGDFGFLGTPIYLGMYGWLLLACSWILRDERLSPYRRVLAEFLIGAIIFILLTNVLIDTFGSPVWAAIIWGSAALLFKEHPDHQEIIEGKEEANV